MLHIKTIRPTKKLVFIYENHMQRRGLNNQDNSRTKVFRNGERMLKKEKNNISKKEKVLRKRKICME